MPIGCEKQVEELVSKLEELNSIDMIEQYWKFLLTQNASISSISKKLRMNLLEEDIYLLFEKSLSKIS